MPVNGFDESRENASWFTTWLSTASWSTLGLIGASGSTDGLAVEVSEVSWNGCLGDSAVAVNAARRLEMLAPNGPKE